MFMSESNLNDAQERLHRPSRSSHPSSSLDLMAEAWVKARGDNRDPKPSARVDARSKCFVALWERTHWILMSSILIGMHPDQSPSRSTEDLSRICAAWVDDAAAFKRRGNLLRKVAKSSSVALQDVDPGSTKSSRGPTPFLDPEIFFESSVPVYPIITYAWMPEGADWINVLEALDQVEPWRV